MSDDSWFAKYPGLEFERHDHGVLLMTISREEHLNATDAPLHNALSRVWMDIDDDDDVRVVVVTGKGKAFSAGGDLDWIETMIQNYDGMKVAFKEAGDIFDPQLAARLKENVYQAGGSRDADVLYRAFRGKDPSIGPLLENRGLDQSGP